MAEIGPEDRKVPVLTVELPEKVKVGLQAGFLSANFVEATYNMAKLAEAIEPSPAIILVGQPPTSVAITEVAQLMRAIYPQAVVYLILVAGQLGDRKALIKNGFSDVFFLPIDQEALMQVIKENLSILGNAQKVYRKVKILDMEPDSTLDFNTYLFLPANNKYVQYSRAGDRMDKEQIERLKGHSVSSLAVPAEEMKKFYEYTAATLKKLNSNSALSETERTERLEGAVRELVTGFFSDQANSTEEGKSNVADLQKIVKTYISDGSNKGSSWYNKLLTLTTQGSSSYSKAMNTSTYAALFGLSLGLAEVEDIALAGLLHDLGLCKVPTQVLETPESQWSQADREAYEGHPAHTVQIIKERKLVVSENVIKVIEQHHEKFAGGGYPEKLAGKEICIGAQILAIADAFDDLTAAVPGRPKLTPKDALAKLVAENTINPSTAAHDPALLTKIAGLFIS